MLVQQRFSERLLASNHRTDGRQPLQYRNRQARFLPTTGSLLYKQGHSLASIKVKAQITAPKNQKPAEGSIFFRVDCQTGQNSHEYNKKFSAQAIKLLETVIIGSKALDPESLCIVTGRYVWKVSIECNVISDDGNLLDCLLNGSLLALMDFRKPLINVEQNKLTVDQKVKQPLSLAHLPLSFTFGLSETNVIIDPVNSEQKAVNSLLTISMNVYKQICSIHKPGGLGITQKVLSGCIKVVEQHVKSLTEWMRETAKQRKPFEGLF